MLKKLLFGAGMAYLARKFIGGRNRSSEYSRNGIGISESRWGRRGNIFGL